MRKIIFSFGVVGILLLSANDIITYDCARPLLPKQFKEQRDYDIYNSNMENYKSCIDAFIAKNKEAIDVRRDAINKAVEDWNSFVASKNSKSDEHSITGSQGIPLGGNHTVGHSDPHKISGGWKF